MKRDCNTCEYKEGSCFPSTLIFDKDKTCKSYEPDYEGYIIDLEKENAELKAQIKKLIDFVLSKTECCDVCPKADVCINSEGTCPYAGILAKGEEEVTSEWLMQFISKEIKENDCT